MDKNYQPKDVEEPIYKMWEDGGYFKPTDNPKAKTFSILLPPQTPTQTFMQATRCM